MDQGSMAAQVWARRFEKLMLILAYILTFCIIFAAAVVGKGVTFFMIAQVAHFFIVICSKFKMITFFFINVEK